MAITLEDYLKSSKNVQSARKKYIAAQANLSTAQSASKGLPAGSTPELRSQIERRIAEAQIQLDAAEGSLNKEEAAQIKYYNDNVNTIQAKAQAKESKSDQNRLAESYAMRQRLISANQSTGAIDNSIKDLNDKINKTGKYAPKTPNVPGVTGGTTGDGTVTYRDYAKELSTVGQAVAKMDESARLALSQGLKAAGYKVPVSGIYSDALINVYTQAIADNQLRSTNFQQEIPFDEFLNLKTVEFSKAGGAGGDGGVGGPFRTISNPTEAAAIIGTVISSLLNRDAKPAEVAALTKILNDAEQKNPQQRVNGKTTGGIDRIQFIADVIKTGVYSDKKLSKSPVLGSLSSELKTKKADKRFLLGEELLATAKANGISLNKPQIDEWTKQVQNGKDIAVIKSQIRNSASLGYPDSIKKMIAEGTDLETIYSPYVQQMATTLGINRESISLNDPTLRGAIGPDKEMPLYEFKRSLRNDNRWRYSQDANDEVRAMISQIKQDFGFEA